MRQILLIALSILLFSCGSENTDKAASKKITFWHFWSEPNQKKALDSIINEFTLKSGIEVETTELSWNDGKTKLLAAFNSGTAPDVIEFGSDWVAQFSSSGVLAEINTKLDNYLDWAKEPCLLDSKVYAKPWIVDSRVMFYNKDILSAAGFEKAANNFQDIFNHCLAIQLNKDNGANGFGLNGPDPNRLYKKALIFSWSAGGDILISGESVLDNPLNHKALSMYARFKNVALIDNQKNLDNNFVQGKLAYTISGGWLLDKIRKENPDLNFGVMKIPNFDGHSGVSFAGGEYLSVSKGSKNQQSAVELVEFLTDGKNSIEFCKKIIEAGFPADKRYYQDDFYKQSPNRLIISSQLESARMTPVHPKWLEIQDEIEKAYEMVLFKDIRAEESIKEADRKIKKILSN